MSFEYVYRVVKVNDTFTCNSSRDKRSLEVSKCNNVWTTGDMKKMSALFRIEWQTPYLPWQFGNRNPLPNLFYGLN